mmetsp:Transcript_16827/g.21394  ORF Transcript_16827/g.21394 Transcript_16827/m.21394 type:complete len:126 (+) Transcript_16827:479-856(+)
MSMVSGLITSIWSPSSKYAALSPSIQSKLFTTIVEKSTAGWNIWYNFLEFTEGFLSLVQIVLDSYMKGGRSGIIGNLAVFLLGIATIVFDSIFLVNEVSIDGFSIHTVAVSKINLMESQAQEIHA